MTCGKPVFEDGVAHRCMVQRREHNGQCRAYMRGPVVGDYALLEYATMCKIVKRTLGVFGSTVVAVTIDKKHAAQLLRRCARDGV